MSWECKVADARPLVLPKSGLGVIDFQRRNSEALNNQLDGRSNAIGTVTLTASQATTTVTDRRVGTASRIVLMPTTANAAAEIATGNMYVSDVTARQFTITHTNNAQTDRTFDYAIKG